MYYENLSSSWTKCYMIQIFGTFHCPYLLVNIKWLTVFIHQTYSSSFKMQYFDPSRISLCIRLISRYILIIELTVVPFKFNNSINTGTKSSCKYDSMTRYLYYLFRCISLEFLYKIKVILKYDKIDLKNEEFELKIKLIIDFPIYIGWI